MSGGQTFELAYGARSTSVEYWQQNRCRAADLYPSESHFLLPALAESRSVLDVGCAAGGGYAICTEINERIAYTGIDVCENLITAARERYPRGRFQCYDGHALPFAERAFDCVYSLGVCHHLLHWRDVVSQIMGAADRFAVFDLRLTNEDTVCSIDEGYQKIAFGEDWDGSTRIPYVVINVDEILEFLNGTLPPDASCEVFAYTRAPTSLAVIPYTSVVMASFCVTRDAAETGVLPWQMEESA